MEGRVVSPTEGNRCAWCNRRVLATVDDDGDPACPSGLGCARSKALSFADIARPLHISEDALHKRALRCGSLEGAIAKGAKGSNGGRPARRPEGAVYEIAQRLGCTKQALYKAARKAGRSIDAEIDRRTRRRRRRSPREVAP
jgi:hypothetical protein